MDYIGIVYGLGPGLGGVIERIIQGTIVGAIKGHTRSLDYSSYSSSFVNFTQGITYVLQLFCLRLLVLLDDGQCLDIHGH